MQRVVQAQMILAAVWIPKRVGLRFGLRSLGGWYADSSAARRAGVCIERRTDLTQINELMGWLLYVVDLVGDPSDVICGPPHASCGQSVRSPP
jgi:hypothetical protein